MLRGRPQRRRANLLTAGLLSAAATTCGLLALARPRPSSLGHTASTSTGSSAALATRSLDVDAGLLAELREARDQRLSEERTWQERLDPSRARRAFERARELELAIALIEQMRRRPADPLDPERCALLCAARIQMLGAELPSERRVALELRVRGLRAELERACAHEPAASSDRSGAMDSGNAEVGTDDGELELRGSAADALEIELRSASAVALREALIERLALRAEPCPVTLSARRFEVRAQGIDAAELLRDAAGCSGWRIAGAFENDARVVLRWIPWGAAPSPAEREEMLERIAASTLALETAPIADFTRAEARFLRARALEALGDEQRALAEYALLAEQSGSGSWALEALRRSAGIHARRGDAERALLCWEAVLAREPDEPLRHLALLQSADLQLARGLRDAARERYEELLRLRPDGAAARAARLGRLACLFERELAQATPQRLRLLASELASEADARRDPQLRPRYLALSSALLRRIGATPLSLRETLAACVEESDAARREQAALAAAALALELNAPLAALWSLDLAPTATCAPAAELRAAARALLGFDDIDTAGASSSARAKEAAEGLANANDKELMPRLDALERTLARLRERRVTQELSR